MQKYLMFVFAILLGALMLAGCGGGSTTGVGDASSDSLTGIAGDSVVIDKGPGFYEGKSLTNGLPQEFGSYYIDEMPDTYWCMYYGQWYKYGGAGVVFTDPPGDDDPGEGWYMFYWLSDEAYGDGWGLSECHVNYQPTEPDAKKGGIPGKYPFKWEWDPVYDDTPPQYYYLPIGDGPAADDYLAIHAVIVKGYWNDDYEWVETANETGWGGYCKPTKASPDVDPETFPWEGNWNKKWGGWVSAWGSVPMFDPIDRVYNASNPYGNIAYWKVVFNPDGNYPFDPFAANGNPWPGWCTDPTFFANGKKCRMFSCYDPMLIGTPAESNNWDLISWIINEMNNGDGSKWYHRSSANFNYAKVQRAIWHFKFGDGVYSPNSYPTPMPDNYNMAGYNANNTDVRMLIDDAIANGEGYYPGPGEYYAVVLIPVDGSGDLQFYVSQVNIIEVDP